jgi:8-oxo-dGTP diphosphatase|tara:strand:+ start:53 stop:475 length:423 start_codon:yes stop_codon:yes gene_type:complete
MSSKKFIEFEHIFPFSVVEIIICDENNNFLLTKRAIEPFKNKWHFPGGLVEKNTSLKKMVKIIAKREVGLDVKIDKFIGVYESIMPKRHDISHLYLTHYSKGTIKLDFQSTDSKFFKRVPNNIVPYHRKMWLDAKEVMLS